MIRRLPGLVGRAIARIDAVGWLTAYLLLLLFIPSRLILGPLGSAGAPSMLFGLGSLLLWIILFLGVSRPHSTHLHPIRAALGVFLVCVGVSFVLAMAGPVSPDEVSPADVALVALASWSGTLLLTQDGVHDRGRVDTLVWRLTVCGGLIALLGLIQVATRQLWVDRLSIPGLFSSPPYGAFTRGGYPRPSGTAIHPIEYGVLLAILLPIALHVGFFHSHRKPVVRWLPAIALAAIIPLTSSRSAYLGAAIGLVFCFIGWPKVWRLRVLGIGATGLLAMAVVAPNFVSSLLGLFTGVSEDPSIASRTNSFSMAFELVGRDPWFGRGLGTFLPKYRIFDNQYLLLLVTVGIVGTVAFLIIGITAMVVLQRLRSRVDDDETRDLAIALMGSVCAGFVCLFMFDAFAFPMTMGTLFFVLGLAGALNRQAVMQAEPQVIR